MASRGSLKKSITFNLLPMDRWENLASKVGDELLKYDMLLECKSNIYSAKR